MKNSFVCGIRQVYYVLVINLVVLINTEMWKDIRKCSVSLHLMLNIIWKSNIVVEKNSCAAIQRQLSELSTNCKRLVIHSTMFLLAFGWSL